MHTPPADNCEIIDGGEIVSDDPIGSRLDAALRWCERRRAQRAALTPHPTDCDNILYSYPPLRARTKNFSHSIDGRNIVPTKILSDPTVVTDRTNV